MAGQKDAPPYVSYIAPSRRTQWLRSTPVRVVYLDACALSLLLLASSSSSTVTASIADNGKVATVNGIKYYVGGIAVSKLTGIASRDLERAAEADVDVIPLTVIRTDEAEFTAQTLEATVSNYTASDDVFQEGFLRGGSTLIYTIQGIYRKANCNLYT